MRHLALIDEALGLAAPSGEAVLLELRALDILAAFPKTPARYGAALLDRATGDRKLVRESSRELLEPRAFRLLEDRGDLRPSLGFSRVHPTIDERPSDHRLRQVRVQAEEDCGCRERIPARYGGLRKLSSARSVAEVKRLELTCNSRADPRLHQLPQLVRVCARSK